MWKCSTGKDKMHSLCQSKYDETLNEFTYFPILSGRVCNEISLMERQVRFRSSGKLSGNLEK